MKSFRSLLKREWINRFKITDYNHAYKFVFEYIEAFYDTVRIHSHCGYALPNKYEKKYWIKLRYGNRFGIRLNIKAKSSCLTCTFS